MKKNAMQPIDFERCCRLCPQLRELAVEVSMHVKANVNNPDYCAHEHWYGKNGYRGRVAEFVGWESGVPGLKTSEAYDVCYDHLYGMLPDCNHQGICRG